MAKGSAVSSRQLKVLVGGVQLRDGVGTVVDLVGRILTRAGLHVLANERNYASTIYGAHQFDPLVIAAEPPVSHGDNASDILVALEYDANPDVPAQPNRDTIIRHGQYLADGGVLLYDSSSGAVPVDEFEGRGVKVFPLPARQIALRELKKEIVKNMVVSGALFRLLEFDMDQAYLTAWLEERFLRKGRELVDLNLTAARRGREVIEEVLKERGWEGIGVRLEPNPPKEMMLWMTGSEALGMGAIQAGCRFYAGYPITPASPLLAFMDRYLPQYGGRSLQGQNERESIRAALGASMAGARVMVASSGPGISLKVEEFGLAGTAEIPIVVVDSQRAGPSTGMPTKTEQGDLRMMLGAGHGDFPRIVLAPSTLEECYTMAFEAFHLADKYQCPVFFLTDLTLAEVRKTVSERFFTERKVTVQREGILSEEELRRDGFKRYKITDSGISSRALPGTPGGIFKVSGTEHDEFGFVTTEPPRRKAMMEKRMRKLETYLREDAQGPQVYGDPAGVPVLVGWGSTKPVLLDARTALAAEGIEAAVVHLTHLWPFPIDLIKPVLERASALIVCELNFTGQLADLIQEQCLLPTRRVLKYNGRVFYVADIIRGVREILGNGASEVRVGELEHVAAVEAHEGD
jgi:2-oxoglutarate ferredoxin oxidoreductase subunit alpha